MGILYIVATPIGNLNDITLRALDVLKEADLVVAEDTRSAKILLSHFNIKKPIISYFPQSPQEKIDEIIRHLEKNGSAAYISEAGTPGISDPGQKLIRSVLEKLPDTKIVPIPGPSAAVAALSVSGFDTSRFVFLGFPPSKKGRGNFFAQAAAMQEVVVFYESPHRIIKTLGELGKLSGSRRIMVAREMTKKFETIYRGTVAEVLVNLKPEEIRGEFVIVLDKTNK